MSEPFSLSSNTESLSYTGGGSSGQWSLPAGVSSPWSLMFQQASPPTTADQQFTLSETQFLPYEFQSLPDTAVTDGYNVQRGQPESSGLSLGSHVIGSYNAASLLLPRSQTLASAVDDVWYGGMSTVQCNNQLSAFTAPPAENVAPIPAFVTNASYDGMF